jgi:hypothetical protein
MSNEAAVTELRMSGKEKIVYDEMSYNHDTLVVDLFRALYPNVPAPDLRRQHMMVGKFISRLNDKLVGGKIKPGHARASYRLYLDR